MNNISDFFILDNNIIIIKGENIFNKEEFISFNKKELIFKIEKSEVYTLIKFKKNIKLPSKNNNLFEKYYNNYYKDRIIIDDDDEDIFNNIELYCNVIYIIEDLYPKNYIFKNKKYEPIYNIGYIYNIKISNKLIFFGNNINIFLEDLYNNSKNILISIYNMSNMKYNINKIEYILTFDLNNKDYNDKYSISSIFMFSNLKINGITGIINNNFLQFTTYKKINISSKYFDNEYAFEWYEYLYKKKQKFQNKKFNMSIDSINEINKYLERSSEIGGYFIINKSNPDFYSVELNKNKIKISNRCNVDFEDKDMINNITFHTHPQFCYDQTGFISGFASSQDFKFIYESYLKSKNIKNTKNKYFSGNLCHFIFSIEGMYYIKLSNDAKIFIDFIEEYPEKNNKISNNKILNGIQSYISNKFENLTRLHIDNHLYYLKIMENLNFSTIFENNLNILNFYLKTSFNFKFYDIIFIKKDDIITNSGLWMYFNIDIY